VRDCDTVRITLLAGCTNFTWTVHESGVVHGDLTGSNILINSQGKPCLCDFGLSKIILEFSGTSYFTGTRGAVRWAASELYCCLDDDEHVPVINKQCDIYSYGSVMLQVLSGQIPYHYMKSDGQVVINLYYGITPKRPNTARTTDELWDFIGKCWAEPTERPTIGQVSIFVHQYRSQCEDVSNPSDSESDVGPSRSSKVKESELHDDFEQDSTVPLICRETPMSDLRAEYESQDVPSAFLSQIDWLIDKDCDYVRRTKGDGDSFYRSVAFAFIERVFYTPDDIEVAESTLQSTRSLFEIAGIDPSAYTDFLEITTSILRQTVTPDLTGEKLTVETLLETFQTVEVSNSVVLYLRLLTSAQMRADPDSYQPFLLDFQMEPVDFCKSYVEPIGTEADDIQIAALSRALGTTIQIAKLQDQPMGNKEFNFEPFGIHRGSRDSGPIVLLRRPGHFELLYSSRE